MLASMKVGNSIREASALSPSERDWVLRYTIYLEQPHCNTTLNRWCFKRKFPVHRLFD